MLLKFKERYNAQQIDCRMAFRPPMIHATASSGSKTTAAPATTITDHIYFKSEMLKVLRGIKSALMSASVKLEE
jgi:hypothetical protein